MQTQQTPLESLPDYGEAFETFKKQITASSKLAEREAYPEAFGYLAGAGNALILKTSVDNQPVETPVFGYCAD